jgi:hypothetical protein
VSHITIAASANGFKELFAVVRDNFTFAKSDGASFGPFSASYSVKLHLSGGTVQLNDDDTIEVKHLDVVWDTLKLTICFELPGFTIPGFCIVPDPWNGCLVGVPDIPIGGPICVPLNLSGLVSEISDLKASLKPLYFIDPARDPSWSDLDAEFNGHPNKWKIFIDPEFVLVEPIDVPGTVANVFENLVKDAVEDMFPSWLPGWAKHLVLAALGPILDLVTGLLNIADDITDFIGDLLGPAFFGIIGLLETAVADYFAAQYPIYQFEDPYPILEAGGGLIPVKIPIRDLESHVNSKEMIVTADVGA